MFRLKRSFGVAAASALLTIFAWRIVRAQDCDLRTRLQMWNGRSPQGDDMVHLTRTENGKTVKSSFKVTSRPLQFFREQGGAPQSLLDLDELRRGRVLDVGSGASALAKDYVDAGIDAVALDLAENSATRAFAPHMIRGDMTALPLADGSIRTIISTYSHFTFSEPNEVWKAVSLKALREFRRVAQTGGRIILYPVNRAEIEGLASQVPGLRPLAPAPGVDASKYLEIEITGPR